MHTFLRSTILAALALVACSGILGCSTETDSDTGKMAKPMDKMDTGKMGGTRNKMDTDTKEKGKME